ncbi:unnamed protein product [Linum trigynum]|uniref:Uncharacterized protein n=1 Tax=Linum trigynum TaxID=586398 RepID=A0AAV2DLA6_9ROSI
MVYLPFPATNPPPPSVMDIWFDRPPKSIKFRARIRHREVFALVHSGAERNFINQVLAMALGLSAAPVEPFRVRTANGEELVCRIQYKRVMMNIQGFEVSTTLYALPIIEDVILGVQWLQELGPVTCDWNLRTMKFQSGDKEHLLRGLP